MKVVLLVAAVATLLSCSAATSCGSVDCSAPGFACVDGQCTRVQVTCEQIQCEPGMKRICRTTTFLCNPGYVCSVNEGCVPELISVPLITCANRKCEPGYECVEPGRCVRSVVALDEKCLMVKCSIGHVCKEGRCVKAPLLTEDEVKSGLSCDSMTCARGFHCVDPGARCVPNKPLITCANMLCPEGQVCVEPARCVPELLIDERCFTVKCSAGYVCRAGRCVKQPNIVPLLTCANRLCPPGQVCVEPGRCVRMGKESCRGVLCRVGHVCRDGRCVPDFTTGPSLRSCIGYQKCPRGFDCVDTLCVPNNMSCAAVLCRLGQICIGGRCVDDPMIGGPAVLTCNSVTCPAGQVCLEPGRCVPDKRCFTVKCRAGYVCVEGGCVPAFVKLEVE